MMTDSTKRQVSLNLLQKLRKQGLPQREEQVDSMFDSLTGGGEPGESGRGDEADEAETPEYELQSPEQQAREREKKKGPNLDQSKVEKFKKGFMSVK